MKINSVDLDLLEQFNIESYEEDGTQTVKQISKEILSQGAWATLIFKFVELDKTTGEWKEPQALIQRYQKKNGSYKIYSKHAIPSPEHARTLIEILSRWFPENTENSEENYEF